MLSGSSRVAKQRPCSRGLMAQAAVPAAATRCWAAWRSCSSCAFAMHSMAQPRRSRAERILAVISPKDGHFVAQIRILSLGAPQPPEQASRGRALPGVGASSPSRSREKSSLCGIISGTGNLGRGSGRERRPHGFDPRNALYVRYTGCLGRIVITERQKGSGAQDGCNARESSAACTQ